MRTRVLRLFRRRDLLSPDDAAAMRHWEHPTEEVMRTKVHELLKLVQVD